MISGTPTSIATGTYTITASNAKGSATSSVTLKAVDPLTIGIVSKAMGAQGYYPAGAAVGSDFYTGYNSLQTGLSRYRTEPNGDAAWKTLTPTGTPPPERSQSTWTTLGNKIYVFGGGAGPTVVPNDLYMYDPSVGLNGHWTRLAPQGTPPSRRTSHSTVVLNGKLYLFGGLDTAANAPSNELFTYDPETGTDGTWSSVVGAGAIPVGRYGHTAGVISGKMYIFSGSTTNNLSFSTTMAVYDPSVGANGTWTSLAPTGVAPSKRGFTASASIGGKLYIYGGYGNSVPNYKSDTFSYDPSVGASGQWTELTPAGATPHTRMGAAYDVIDGKLFVVSGAGDFGDPEEAYRDYNFFDPSKGANGTWISKYAVGGLAPRVSIGAGDTLPYLVLGGYPPYTVTRDAGAISNATGSGTFTESGAPTSTLTVTDAEGNTATAEVVRLEIIPASTTVNFYETTAYTVVGGGGPYVVESNKPIGRTQPDAAGVGTFTSDFCDTCSFTLTVTDTLSNATATSVTIHVNGIAPMSVDVASPSIAGYGSTTYSITGGANTTYNVFADSGMITPATSRTGTFVASGENYVDTIHVVDNYTGLTIDVPITVAAVPALSITIPAPTANIGSVVPYTITGGSGNYNVYTDYDWWGMALSNATGSGNYTPDYNTYSVSGGTDTITVSDNITGQSASVGVTLTLVPLSIIVSSSTLDPLGTTTYTISGGSGNYWVEQGSGSISDATGTGTYTADGCTACTDTITVYDNNTGDSAFVDLTIN